MPAATTRADLLAVTTKEWLKLRPLLGSVPDGLAAQTDAEGTSIKDIVTHRAHWIGLFFQWIAEGTAAETPDHGVKWSDLKTYNAALRARYAAMDWAEALAWLDAEHARLMAFLETAPEVLFYGAPMPGGNGKWSTGRYAEAAGPSHYRSAAKYVRARLRDSPDA